MNENPVWHFAPDAVLCDSPLQEFVPTCEGNCYSYSSFGAVLLTARGLDTISCKVYSDPNCQNKIEDAGDNHDGITNDLPVPGQSLICYAGC